MSVHSFTDAQVDKARHALGLDRGKRGYRNYYSSYVPDPEWEDLVARGMAVKRKSPVSPDWLYHLTKQAAFYFMNPGDALDSDLRFATLSPPVQSEE